ncbi:H-NS histone family protein [Methylotetracoccus oryzae]|uniref:H-NS histone family protein n=1 Tax=Methylotetracoccus oryzae TaxID=1919059 RepID=UPI00111B11F0|nr:H-NS histone family protein [Methylotetracoccus oryzae]
MTDFSKLSEQELSVLIADASKALEAKRQQARRDVLAQIKSLASTIGVDVQITEQAPEANTRKGSKVAIKYRDPGNPNNAWSGRGVKPRWLQEYVDQGRSVDEFRV